MLVKVLFCFLFALTIFILWLSYQNPMDVEFHFFGEIFETDLSTLLISSFVMGAMVVFIGTLTRDAKRAFQNYKKSREEKKSQSLKEELDKGVEDLFRGDLRKAKAHFAEVLKRDPMQTDLYFRLSEISVKEGNDEEALHWLERAHLIDMKNVDVLLREADLYQRMKRFDEAIRTLHRAIAQDDTNLNALRGLREIYLNCRRWEEALKIQKAILKLTKGKQAEEEETLFSLGLQYEHARDLLNRGGKGELETALKEAREIVREKRTFELGFVLLGDIYLRMGKWESAGKVWEKSFKRFKSIIFILRLEDLYLNREDPTALINFYQAALRENPDHGHITFFYAKLCLRLELLDEALEAIDEISLKRKDFPALHRLLAEIYLHRKDFSRAAQEFEKTFEMSGTSYLPFSCKTCERESKEWTAYCPQCHQWSTYTIKESEKIFPLHTPSFSERAHFPL